MWWAAINANSRCGVDPTLVNPNHPRSVEGPKITLAASVTCPGCGGSVTKTGPRDRQRYCSERCRDHEYWIRKGRETRWRRDSLNRA